MILCRTVACRGLPAYHLSSAGVGVECRRSRRCASPAAVVASVVGAQPPSWSNAAVSARNDSESVGDLLDVGLAGGHVHDESEGGLVTQVGLAAVESQEDD